jgi:hypothetical protein
VTSTVIGVPKQVPILGVISYLTIPTEVPVFVNCLLITVAELSKLNTGKDPVSASVIEPPLGAVKMVGVTRKLLLEVELISIFVPWPEQMVFSVIGLATVGIKGKIIGRVIFKSGSIRSKGFPEFTTAIA